MIQALCEQTEPVSKHIAI